MATQATNNHAKAKEKQANVAAAILEAAGRKALDEKLGGSERYNWAKLYLSKTLPDLKAVEHSGETSVRVTKVEREIVDHAAHQDS